MVGFHPLSLAAWQLGTEVNRGWQGTLGPHLSRMTEGLVLPATEDSCMYTWEQGLLPGGFTAPATNVVIGTY